MPDAHTGMANAVPGQRPPSVSISHITVPSYRAQHNHGVKNSVGPRMGAYPAVFNRIRSGAAALGVPSGARAYRTIGKRILDLALVILMAPFALPLIGFAALLLRVEGGAPFYRQARLGKGGSTFQILKLRTMVCDADQMLARLLATNPALRAEWERTQKLKRDPRITRVGALLRKTSLDELPQLWNVLLGEMTLVGPRPMLPEQLPLYGDARHYFALKPGITGTWQVSERNESTFTARAALDAEYDGTLSLGEDAKILWRTIGAVVKRTGY